MQVINSWVMVVGLLSPEKGLNCQACVGPHQHASAKKSIVMSYDS